MCTLKVNLLEWKKCQTLFEPYFFMFTTFWMNKTAEVIIILVIMMSFVWIWFANFWSYQASLLCLNRPILLSLYLWYRRAWRKPVVASWISALPWVWYAVVIDQHVLVILSLSVILSSIDTDWDEGYLAQGADLSLQWQLRNLLKSVWVGEGDSWQTTGS